MGKSVAKNYYDGTTVRFAVSTLSIPNATTRTETRADGKTRGFTYTTAGYLTTCTDFKNHSASQGYDNNKWINSVTDRNGHTTNYTCDPLTGNVLQVQFPLTPVDTPGQGNTRPTINYTYGSASCADPNNRDSNNPYYVCTATDEGGHVTQFWRGTLKRITRIDYPDGGYETFGYDAAHFYQPSTHRMKTGGTERFAYDTRHRLQYYSDPYHSNPDNPSITYYYNALDRVSGIVDTLNHSTNFDYNDRGQVTTITLPWYNGTRYTIVNFYNPDGTLQKRTDELGHTTNYTYDDYRRLKSVTPPIRGSNDNGTYITNFYYGANYWDGLLDYYYTDSNVTFVVLPSLKKIKTDYDDNRRKSTVTAAYTTADEAVTSYTYDNAGNLSWVINPLNRNNVNTLYDARNRPYSVSVGSHTTTISYDTAGRRKEIDRPNGQVITYDTFDVMNRVTQQTATQTPSPDAVTKFSYYTTADGANAPVGLLKTMKDPHLVALNNGQVYTYAYDLMGRKQSVTYPNDSTHTNRTEQWSYDVVGRLYQFTNRAGKIQTFSYDQLSRMSGFTWNDGGITPGVTFGYDAASRLTEIDNANATISRSYYNDDLLHMETQNLSGSGGVDNRHVIYTYDGDGNLATVGIPGYTFDYLYTNRNQVKWINDDASGAHQAYYEYDTRGNVTLRNVYSSPVAVSNYQYDNYDRPTLITHTLNGTSRSFNYGYYANSDNLEFVRRLGSSLGDIGDVFRYDRADQAISFQLNVATPQNVDGGSIPQKVFYDSNGNRTSFTSADSYDTANNLNQYTNRTTNNQTYHAEYDISGNLAASPEGTSMGCTYDAQNRLLSATKDGATMSFKYDGLNRQVSRTVSGTMTYSTWDGWDLVEEYTNNPNLVIQGRYLYGPSGLVKELQNNRYYFQDASGSTALLADSTAHLLEWYRYDLQGAPFFYAPNDTQLSASNYSVCHLLTGQRWYSDIGLYDLRNRFYSLDLGRFLQPDSIGFWGDRSNLYRYCKNNPVTRWDPFGLDDLPPKKPDKNHSPADIPTGGGNSPGSAEAERVTVTGGPIPSGFPINEFPPSAYFSSGPGIYNPEFGYRPTWIPFARPSDDDEAQSPSLQQPPPSSVPAQNPTTQVSAAALVTPPATLAPAAGVFSLWQQMLITAFNDRIGDHDNLLGPGDIATADLRYRPSDFNARNRLIHVYHGTPLRAYPQGSLVSIYRQNGSIYAGRITDTGAGFAAHRPGMGLPEGVPGTLWFDIWTPSGGEDPEWDLVLIRFP